MNEIFEKVKLFITSPSKEFQNKNKIVNKYFKGYSIIDPHAFLKLQIKKFKYITL